MRFLRKVQPTFPAAKNVRQTDAETVLGKLGLGGTADHIGDLADGVHDIVVDFLFFRHQHGRRHIDCDAFRHGKHDRSDAFAAEADDTTDRVQGQIVFHQTEPRSFDLAVEHRRKGVFQSGNHGIDIVDIGIIHGVSGFGKQGGTNHFPSILPSVGEKVKVRPKTNNPVAGLARQNVVPKSMFYLSAVRRQRIPPSPQAARKTAIQTFCETVSPVPRKEPSSVRIVSM